RTLEARIRSELARRGSVVFVPARIAQVEELPVTHSGKRSEAAARDAVNRRPVRNRAALRNSDSLGAIARGPALSAAALAGRAPRLAPASGYPAGACGGHRTALRIPSPCLWRKDSRRLAGAV